MQVKTKIGQQRVKVMMDLLDQKGFRFMTEIYGNLPGTEPHRWIQTWLHMKTGRLLMAVVFEDGSIQVFLQETSGTWPESAKALDLFTIPENEKAYLVVQEGGSSAELYVHSHETAEQAEQDRHDCSDKGSYRTSEVLEIPSLLASQPGFYEAVEEILTASRELDYPAEKTEEVTSG